MTLILDKCPVCKQPAGLSLEDEVTVSIVCPLGHRRYFYKLDNGKWESQEARRRRLIKCRVCERCEKEYMLADHRTSYQDIRNFLCPDCAEVIIRERSHRWKNRVSVQTKSRIIRSPWRMPMKSRG